MSLRKNFRVKNKGENTMAIKKKGGLGRGLGALMGTDEPAETLIRDNDVVTELKLTKIVPDENQPRKDFDDEKLKALSDSIAENGVIQPLIVADEKNGFYRIIAGERRWRASKMAGLETVPVVIRDYTSEQSAAVSLVENLQREDLNAIEEAFGYKRLMEEFNLTQAQVAEKVGKSRPAVANTLRLLNLPENIRDMVIYGEISSGHARAIAGLSDEDMQKDLAQKVIAEDLNVRQLEKLISDIAADKNVSKASSKKVEIDKNLKFQLKIIEKSLMEKFGTKVKISTGNKKGKIEFEYYDSEELERLIKLLNE